MWFCFMMHTQEESIIKKVCAVLEKILSHKMGEKLISQREIAYQGKFLPTNPQSSE